MLLDSARIQEEDAEFKRQRHQREGRKGPFPEIPLYTVDDAEAVFPLLTTVKYRETVQIGAGVEAAFYDAGHVLGSSMIKIMVNQGGEKKTVLFSGDVGSRNKPILRDPTIFDQAHYVVVESTYGDRLHDKSVDIGDNLAKIINSTWEARGNVIIPSFALERAQEVLYYLNELLLEDRIPHLKVFVDSPMANSITEVFEHHPELYDEEMAELIRQKKSPFDFPGLELVRTVDESKAINHIVVTVLVIAGSGMCTGGRIKHHLVTNISRRECAVLFVGYQAVGTLGRSIVEGAKKVRILGQHYPVRAKIAVLDGFSAHADRDGLFRWLSGFKKSPRHLFVVHGEARESQQFGDFLQDKFGWPISIPEYGSEHLLE
jgi:metallo-beta-lactamase family protein